MKTYALVILLLGGSVDCLSQPGTPAGPSFRVMLLQDSTGEKTKLAGTLARDATGRLLVEAEPNDIRKEIYDRQLIIEVIHARGSSPVTTIALTGLKDFEQTDVLKILRPGFQTGDRLVLTFSMMSGTAPSARVLQIR